MIQSMSAFARKERQGAFGSLVCELRSINHRYLELGVRVPETLHAWESLVRDKIRQVLHRGKVECTIRFQPDDTAGSDLTINQDLTRALCKASEMISKMLPTVTPPNPIDILQWPGVLQQAVVDLDSLQAEMVQLLEEAMQDLVAARKREGGELKQLFLQRLDSMKAELTRVRHRLPDIANQQRARLIARFHEAKLELDAGRFEQEMVMLMQKMDVTEELERLDVHIGEVGRVLTAGGVAGRRLDFLMQELNREANTLGAKSVDVETTRASVELKVLIEQMREQVQNIE